MPAGRSPRRRRAALPRQGRRGARELTYAELREQTDRFANVLQALGVKRGERVFVLAGRIPELYVAALGTLKHGSVFCPLFSAFGPEPIAAAPAPRRRARAGHDAALYRRKVAQSALEPARARRTCCSSATRRRSRRSPACATFARLMGAADDRCEIAATAPEDMALLHFTSGTTGMPKGAVHVHEAVVAHHATGRMALDLHPDDVFWCTADPGWVTGTSYGIIAPLTHGVTSIVDEADFDAERWYRILQDERVNVWYTAPTALRMLMRARRRGGARVRPAARCASSPASASR